MVNISSAREIFGLYGHLLDIMSKQTCKCCETLYCEQKCPWKLANEITYKRQKYDCLMNFLENVL
jgi:hypothetical protein